MRMYCGMHDAIAGCVSHITWLLLNTRSWHRLASQSAGARAHGSGRVRAAPGVQGDGFADGCSGQGGPRGVSAGQSEGADDP